MTDALESRTYSNPGNPPLLRLLENRARSILDVGCGAGDNAELIKRELPAASVYGVTLSPQEALLAEPRMSGVWVCDIERGLPQALAGMEFDAVLFSHVLEHLRDPARVVAMAVKWLKTDGDMLIAVPNIVNWRDRLRMLLGDFEYTRDGVMDETHLRFFTYLTADRYLLAQAPQIECIEKRADGSVPLWWLRRHVLPRKVSDAFDRAGVRIWPNLFGSQILLKCRKRVS